MYAVIVLSTLKVLVVVLPDPQKLERLQQALSYALSDASRVVQPLGMLPELKTESSSTEVLPVSGSEEHI